MVDQSTTRKTPLAHACSLSSIELISLQFEEPQQDGKPRAGIVEIELSVDRELKKEASPPVYQATVTTKVNGFKGETNAKQEREPVLKLEATYAITYTLDEVSDWDDREMDHFDANCASYHCWPYVRELVNNLTFRAPLGSIVLPLMPRNPLSSEANNGE